MWFPHEKMQYTKHAEDHILPKNVLVYVCVLVTSAFNTYSDFFFQFFYTFPHVFGKFCFLLMGTLCGWVCMCERKKEEVSNCIQCISSSYLSTYASIHIPKPHQRNRRSRRRRRRRVKSPLYRTYLIQ